MNDEDCLRVLRETIPTVKTEKAARFLNGAADMLANRIGRLFDPCWYVEIRWPDGRCDYERRQWVTSKSWHDPTSQVHLARRPISRGTYKDKEREGRTCLYEFATEVQPGQVLPLRERA